MTFLKSLNNLGLHESCGRVVGAYQPSMKPPGWWTLDWKPKWRAWSQYGVRPPYYIQEVIKKPKCKRTNYRLENGRTYLYLAFQYDKGLHYIHKIYIMNGILHMIFTFAFRGENYWTYFSSVTWNSTIVSNKQWQEHIVTYSQSGEKTSRKPMSVPRASSM